MEEAVSTDCCMCCGQPNLDYLAHLVGTHKFDLDKAKSVVGSESAKRGFSKDDKVLRVGGVPITLPDEGTGDHIHIHLNISVDGGNKDAKGIIGPSGKSPISPQKNPTLPKSKDLTEMTVSMSPSGLVTCADDSGTNPKDEKSVSPKDKDDDDDDVMVLKVCPAKNRSRSKRSERVIGINTEDNNNTERSAGSAGFHTIRKEKNVKFEPPKAKGRRIKEKSEDSVMPSKGLVLSNTELYKNVEKMLKCPHLQTLVENGEVHTCKVCGGEVANSKDEINGHVSTVHGINALQYLALFFPQGKWFEVSGIFCADGVTVLRITTCVPHLSAI